MLFLLRGLPGKIAISLPDQLISFSFNVFVFYPPCVYKRLAIHFIA